MRNFHYFIWALLLLALLPTTLRAQNAPITGVVTDASSQEALLGVTVFVKGTSINAQTGLDGRYSIEDKADAVLTFNYVGYAAQEVPVAGKTAINVALASTTKLNEVVVVGRRPAAGARHPAATKLNEVVVVGYGTQKKRDLTGAVARV